MGRILLKEIENVKEKLIINVWNFLNTYIDEKYRLAPVWGERSKIVDFYCKGKGIEIGASGYPIKINSRQIKKILYVDWVDRNIDTTIGTVEGVPYVHVDIIDDAEKLDKIRDKSLDFIIHCHVLEHCRNPINVIRTQMSKLRRGGVLFIALPNKSSTFDKKRPLTSWKHFILDDEMISEERDRGHFREYLQLASKFKGDIESEIDRLLEDDYRPHFHVWDFDSFYDFLLQTNDRLNNLFIIEHYSENILRKGTAFETKEIITVLRKR